MIITLLSKIKNKQILVQQFLNLKTKIKMNIKNLKELLTKNIYFL